MTYPEDEKALEKQQEKTEEKQDESWQEKTRRDPLAGIIWPVILIWLGVAMMIDRFGLLASIPVLADLSFWALFSFGAGVILLGEVVVRLLVPEYRQPVGGTIFFAVLLMASGISQTVGWSVFGPIALIGLGLILLASSLMRNR